MSIAEAGSEVGVARSQAPDPTDIAQVFEAQARRRDAIRTSSAAERCAKLVTLRDAILAHFPQTMAALAADLGKPPFEAMMDAGSPLGDIDQAIASLGEWMQPLEVTPGPYAAPGATAQVIYQPKGRVLIFGPWNFPFSLCLQPLIAAVAAGNTVVLKPSEMAPATSAVIAKIVRQTFDATEVAVIEGGPDVARALLEQPFDHIFFTGSTQVGREVMRAASRHLASVTLELGGKCPVIVDVGFDPAIAADRISWGKYLNAGQICLTPDHVWVTPDQRDAFAAAAVDYVRRGYHADGAFAAADCARIINARHFERLAGLLEDAVAQGARILCGGASDGSRLEPTVLVDVPRDCALMREEVFGPILPILTYQGLDDVLGEINGRDKPLALYVFSDQPAFVDEVLARTSSGGVTVNDVIHHAADCNLPFGGVGASGMGAYHGVYGFRELSHGRSVYRQATVNPTEAFMRPPYGDRLPG